MLYLLADGILYEQWPLKNEPEEYVHDKTLEMMQLLIDKGADVNYAAYRAMYEECHGYTDEYSIYGDTDRCGCNVKREGKKSDPDLLEITIVQSGQIVVTYY